MRNDDITVLWERYISLLHSGSPEANDAYWDWRDAGGEPNCSYEIPPRLPTLPEILSLRRPVKFLH